VSKEDVDAVRGRLGAGDRIVEFDLEPITVSSTEIRARVARGEPIEDLVSRPVADEIARLGLYRDGE
jgi:nicotinic acid mononucleotide adenylyltransferase